ncbi:hypothetical protein RFM23_24155 [Mesorhizobium abyssinicae]|uniref:DUF768 domain-containing protein n=1 Tax=Mesorhizobium abyssinicae TaxID=1209958 RepID=A0ABU5ATV3_9HYPH|nr:hypothetical protein [Mesorhizobium abyssinicae]MDX8540715.1 hypothetical protein [Mesorhizobium abyssinicae]
MQAVGVLHGSQRSQRASRGDSSEDEIEEEIGSAYEAILAAINGPPDFGSD